MKTQNGEARTSVTSSWEDRIVAEQESILRSIQDLTQDMQDNYIDMTRIVDLEALVRALKAFEEEFAEMSDKELLEEEELMRREDEAERIRAIEDTQR